MRIYSPIKDQLCSECGSSQHLQFTFVRLYVGIYCEYVMMPASCDLCSCLFHGIRLIKDTVYVKRYHVYSHLCSYHQCILAPDWIDDGDSNQCHTVGLFLDRKIIIFFSILRTFPSFPSPNSFENIFIFPLFGCDGPGSFQYQIHQNNLKATLRH